MAVTDQLGKPLETAHQMGRFTLNRIVRDDASALQPVAWTNMDYVVGIDIGAPSWNYEADVHQQGSGDEKSHIKRGPRWDGTITVLSGYAGNVIASILGITWSGTAAAISLRMDTDIPMVHWEAICRQDDNKTHLFSLVIQDMILDDIGFSNPIDYADKTIPFHTYHEPFLLYTGYEMVFDKWDATPTTPTYSMSCTTPVDLLTSTDHDDWHYDDVVFIKHLDNSEGDTTGRRRVAGVSQAAGVVSFTTGTPAATDEVSVLYAKVTS